MAIRTNKQVSIVAGLKVLVGHYLSVADIDTDAKTKDFALYLANMNMQQKAALPDANAFLEEHILNLVPRFPIDPAKAKVVEKTDDKGVKTQTTEDGETPGDRIKRFIGAVDSGKYTLPGVTPGKDAGLKYLQAQLDKHGAFDNDASKPIRVGKAKQPSKMALNAAESVFGSVETQNAKLAAAGKPTNFDAKKRTAFIKAQCDKLAKDGFPVTITDDEATNKLAFAWAVQHREDKRTEDALTSEFAAPVS